MSRGADPGLPEWVDECGDLLTQYFVDPKHWQAAQDRAQCARFDGAVVDEQMRQRSEAGRAIFGCAWRLAKESFLPDFDHWRIVVPAAERLTDTLGWWALAAAEQVEPIMAARWGDCMPAGFPQLSARRSQRAVEQALATRRHGETLADILARAGVSRAHGYRILDKKTHGRR